MLSATSTSRLNRNWIVAAAFTCAMIVAACSDTRRPQQLPALGARMDQTSVSGISSGAYMAGQFEVAHSRLVVGAALIAGGPYGCAESIYADVMPGPGSAFLNLSKAVNGCMLDALKPWGIPNPHQLAERAKSRAGLGQIDPIASLTDDRLYLFSGKEDRTVVPAIVAAAVAFYEDVGVPASQIKYITDIAAGHAFVTETRGGTCSRSATPYVVDCDYDQAGELLSQIYGPMIPPAVQGTGDYLAFDQRIFAQDLGDASLSEFGLAYVPVSCRTKSGCRVHIAFHGCSQNEASVGDAFVKGSGFARWADANDLIVLFPQAAASPINPQGCWDWWGYTGRDYLTRDAPQIKAVYRMLERLAASGSLS